jgi:hypothetical protein
MSKSLWGDPVYCVEYYADGEARERLTLTKEFFRDPHEALAHGAELGKTLRYLKVASSGFADDDSLLATFGTSVKHDKVTHYRFARSYAFELGETNMPGRLRCECHYTTTSWNHMDAHHKLAGTPKVTSFWQYPPEGYVDHRPAKEVQR